MTSPIVRSMNLDLTPYRFVAEEWISNLSSLYLSCASQPRFSSVTMDDIRIASEKIRDQNYKLKPNCLIYL